MGLCCVVFPLILNSQDDCVINTIETSSFAKASNTRDAIPTLPFIPGPETVNIAKFSRDDNALTVLSSPATSLIKDPGESGLCVFLISQGTLAFAHGRIVLGCNT